MYTKRDGIRTCRTIERRGTFYFTLKDCYDDLIALLDRRLKNHGPDQLYLVSETSQLPNE